MSTVTLNYPDVIRVRRAPAIGQILILSTLALIGITILLAVISANADLNNRVAVSQNSIAPLPVLVPTAPSTNTQMLLTETATPAPGPTIVAVPAPTHPSQ